MPPLGKRTPLTDQYPVEMQQAAYRHSKAFNPPTLRSTDGLPLAPPLRPAPVNPFKPNPPSKRIAKRAKTVRQKRREKLAEFFDAPIFPLKSGMVPITKPVRQWKALMFGPPNAIWGTTWGGLFRGQHLIAQMRLAQKPLSFEHLYQHIKLVPESGIGTRNEIKKMVRSLKREKKIIVYPSPDGAKDQHGKVVQLMKPNPNNFSNLFAIPDYLKERMNSPLLRKAQNSGKTI